MYLQGDVKCYGLKLNLFGEHAKNIEKEPYSKGGQHPTSRPFA